MSDDALLNQLLEDAALKATELASHAETGAAAAVSVAKHAQSLGTRAVDAAKSLHAQYEQAIAAMKHASEQSKKAGEEARSAVENVPEAATQAGTTAVELLDNLHGELLELAGMRMRLVKEVATSAGDTEQEFHLLAQQVNELSNRLDGGLKQTAIHLDAMRAALEKGGTEIETARQTLFEGLRALGQQAAVYTTEVGQDIGLVLGTMSRGALALCNEAIQGVNLLAAATRTGILDETADDSDPSVTWMDNALAPLRFAITEFAPLPPTATSTLSSAMSEVLDGAQQAIASLDTVARLLLEAVPRTNS